MNICRAVTTENCDYKHHTPARIWGSLSAQRTCEIRCRPARASILEILSVRNVLDTRKAPWMRIRRASFDSSLGTHLHKDTGKSYLPLTAHGLMDGCYFTRLLQSMRVQARHALSHKTGHACLHSAKS